MSSRNSSKWVSYHLFPRGLGSVFSVQPLHRKVGQIHLEGTAQTPPLQNSSSLKNVMSTAGRPNADLFFFVCFLVFFSPSLFSKRRSCWEPREDVPKCPKRAAGCRSVGLPLPERLSGRGTASPSLCLQLLQKMKRSWKTKNKNADRLISWRSSIPSSTTQQTSNRDAGLFLASFQMKACFTLWQAS